MSIALPLAAWAAGTTPTDDDLALARTALVDTVAVAVAARRHPVLGTAAALSEAGRWGVAAHVLDFDDLHMASTTHISAVCVPAALATGGDARAYLAGAGVMARLGTALGWQHYTAGWHATCTAGAPAAAVVAGTALGLDAAGLATALALAVPAAGGVQRAFGTDAKSLQVGFAIEAGIRAARLAAAGATADPTALDAWFDLLGGDRSLLDTGHGTPAVPGGLAVKLHPCCYAMQRPIAAASGLAVDPGDVRRVVVRAPEGTLAPLIHHRPSTGLQAKFSMEYAVATSLLAPYPGFAAFEDGAVADPDVQRLVDLVELDLSDGGTGLLDGVLELQVETDDGVRTASCTLPPGAPGRAPTEQELARKVDECLTGTGLRSTDITWPGAAALLRAQLP